MSGKYTGKQSGISCDAWAAEDAAPYSATDTVGIWTVLPSQPVWASGKAVACTMVSHPPSVNEHTYKGQYACQFEDGT